ncbi:MAG: uracil-DNA glycosylase family protein [Cellvibrionaceae bacterium]
MNRLIPSHQILINDIHHCRQCHDTLPLGANPVVQLHPDAKLLIIGQAPGTRVHASGIPWDDPSGERLRQWLNSDKETFYDPKKIAIMPMGFCYPGKGRSGDLPPRTECAPLWHDRVLEQLPNIELTLLIGQYAQKHYIDRHADRPFRTLTERVQAWHSFAPDRLPLPHPSPRNRRWFSQQPWFEQEVVPWLQQRTSSLLR